MSIQLYKNLVDVCNLAHERLSDLGLEVPSLRYDVVPHQEKLGDCVSICFDAITLNPNFFGEGNYVHYQRKKLLGHTYKVLLKDVTEMLGGRNVYLDTSVHLDEDSSRHVPAPPPFDGKEIEHGFVDTSKDTSVEIVTLDTAIERDGIEPGSFMEQCCWNYGLKYLVKQGRAYISPDPITVAFFEAYTDYDRFASVIEIGSGSGISGKAASEIGVCDFTFLDINDDICAYLQREFPQYSVRHEDALQMAVERKWNIALIGLPYSFNPLMMKHKGEELSQSCDMIFIQSACNTFFNFQHQRLMGGEAVRRWSWHDASEEVRAHFKYVLEVDHGYQSGIVASNECLDWFIYNLTERGFKRPSYTQVDRSTF